MFFDDKRLRFITLCAYLNEEIDTLIEKEEKNLGEVCIDDEDDFVKNNILKIQSIMDSKTYTRKGLEIMVSKFPRVKFYHETIHKTIKKHIDTGDKWIPSLVIISALQEYSVKGYKCFDSIPFFDCLDKYIFDKRADHKLNLEIALDIVETLEKAEAPMKFLNKKKKKK